VVQFCAMVATFLIATAVLAFSQAVAASVALTGKASCAKCGPFEPMHKGYTQWAWALNSVSKGDDIVLVVGNNTYKLKGNREQLLKYMESKTTAVIWKAAASSCTPSARSRGPSKGYEELFARQD
jgi:hypothetical protein